MWSVSWITALAQIYLLFSFGSLFIITLFGFYLLGFYWQKSSRWVRGWSEKYVNKVISLQYTLLSITIFLILNIYISSSKLSIVDIWSVSFYTEQHTFFFFSLTNLNLFFILMLCVIMLLTTVFFRSSRIEEQLTEKNKYFPAGFKLENNVFFSALMAILHLLLFIFFSTENIFIFFISFESSVLPIFVTIAFFGKRSHKFKALSYLLYFTLLSAAPFFMVLIWLYVCSGSTFYPELRCLLQSENLPPAHQLFCFISLFIPFGVKFAFFPFHTWLPEAHVEASTEGSMLLSGIMLKLGFFGLIKYGIGLFPGILFTVAPTILSMALIGSFATALSTYNQLDIKKIIAYSSVVHMNLSLFGYFAFSATALQAAIFMNFSHAIVSAGLFSVVGLLQDRSGSRNLMELSGLAKQLPLWSQTFFILLLANAGIPGTVGFIAEAPLIWGCFTHFPYGGVILLFPLSVMALRNFILFAQVCWGVPHDYLSPTKIHTTGQFKSGILIKIWDISVFGEGFAPVVFAFLSVLLGIWPNCILQLLGEVAFQTENFIFI